MAPAGRAILLRGLQRGQQGLSVESALGRAPKSRNFFKIFSVKWFCLSERGNRISALQTVLPPIPVHPGQPEFELLGETPEQRRPPRFSPHRRAALGAARAPVQHFSFHPRCDSQKQALVLPIDPACWTLSPTPLRDYLASFQIAMNNLYTSDISHISKDVCKKGISNFGRSSCNY